MKTALIIFTLVCLAGPAAGDQDHADEIEAWHAGRIDRLEQPQGWLSLVGLFALPSGRSSFGSADGMDLRLQSPGPAHVGDIIVDGETVEFVAVAPVRADDRPVDRIELAPDVSGDPTILETGTLSFYLILRHGRPYLRVRDSESPVLAGFDGIERWPVSEQWKIRARWVEYEEPLVRQFPDVLGVAEPGEVRGEARFTVQGREYTLYPNSMSERSVFWVFGDATNGLESYGGGRFLYSEPPDSTGTVVLDFNRAYNPPCVFTPYATCPLPAEGNVLDLEITAGEKMYGEAH